jgi:hypothetical protein
MTIKAPYTRRDIPEMQPDILGRYHDLVMTNNLPGYEKLLDEYQPHITVEERNGLVEDFKRVAEEVLRQRWHLPRSR